MYFAADLLTKYAAKLQKYTPLPSLKDIAYIPTAQGMAYMCAVIDSCGKMALNYRIGNDMTVSLVTNTIQDALKNEKVTDGLALHSDLGSQYISNAYYNLSIRFQYSSKPAAAQAYFHKDFPMLWIHHGIVKYLAKYIQCFR